MGPSNDTNTTHTAADQEPQVPAGQEGDATVSKLRTARASDAPWRPSIKAALLKQRSLGAVVGAITTRQADKEASNDDAASRNRGGSLPKLHRQLSMVLNRTIRNDSAAAIPVLAMSVGVQQKVDRYERMMDRFQLRRVPSARKASGVSNASGALSTQAEGSRLPSHRNSMDGAPTARRSSESSSLYPSAPAVVDVAQHSSALPSTLHHHGSANSSAESVSGLRVHLTTFVADGVCTRLRITALVAVFSVQLVYMPYGVVYYPHDHPATIAIDSAVDGAFLLNVLITCNTATQTVRGRPATSRRAIWRHYRHNGFVLDVLAAVPFEVILHFVALEPWLGWLLRLAQVSLQLRCLYRHALVVRAGYAKEVIRADKSVVAAILYSCYSYLVRIGGIILLITLMAHYFACAWTSLVADADPLYLLSRDPIAIHLDSIYDTLQLLQGQGVRTTTPGQAVFCSVVVLLGSIILAVIFGHVAILVSNFSANQTSYQRKMERVFAIMGKLQLPHPIRERVHQYYEYLHAEYESLDGEIVKFAKELSHTLELEVVLFKYMDVVMHVPHWRECSPDFQKQLVLNLSVRVYLPDDFIMRRGEVGTECYIINRGTCKQHEYETGNYEPATLAMISEEDKDVESGNNQALGAQPGTHAPLTPRRTDKAMVRPKSIYSVPDSARSDADPSESGPSGRATVLKRGQSIGAMSLLANYERSSDLRAVTYVEMCVIERDTFQRILTRYPNDREIVITRIVRDMMLHLADERVPCMLMGMVRDVLPHATVSTGIAMVSSAMNPRENDPSIVFGVTGQLTSRLKAMVATGDAHGTSPAGHDPLPFSHCQLHGAASEHPGGYNRQSPPTCVSSPMMAEFARILTDMHEKMTRMEESRKKRGLVKAARLARKPARRPIRAGAQPTTQRRQIRKSYSVSATPQLD